MGLSRRWFRVVGRNLSTFNIKPLPGGNTGTQMFGWFNKEINSLADLKGLKMRFPGFGGEVFKRAGGTPVNIPGGELYTAMQTGPLMQLNGWAHTMISLLAFSKLQNIITILAGMSRDPCLSL